MKMSKKFLFAAFFMFIQFSVLCQTSMDIGLRYNSSTLNRFQFELRIPFSEKLKFKFGVGFGYESQDWNDRILSANDSVAFIRERTSGSKNNELRAGVEIKVRETQFSVGGDLIASFYKMTEGANTTLTPREDYYGSVTPPSYYFLAGIDRSGSTRLFIGAGLSGFLAWEYPLSAKLLLNLNLSFSTVFTYQLDGSEYNDIYNEFNNNRYSFLNFYSGAGIGLRYKIEKKSNN